MSDYWPPFYIKPVEVSPSTKGWIQIEPRVWKLPDGTFYTFAPTAKEVLVEPAIRFGHPELKP